MDVLDFIEQERQFYDTQTIPLSEGDEFSQKQLIKAINYTHRSKYIDEARDDIIGDFPYDNISKYRVRLEARATDFDTKHIEIEPKNGSREARISAMIATKALQKHMREIKFGKFLNEYADTRPEYGGFLSKTTADGIYKVPWENVINDMSDVLGGVIIERHYKRPSELKKQKNWKHVDDAIREARQRRRKDLDENTGNDAKTISHLIEVWELHGEIEKHLYEHALAVYEDREYVHDEHDEGVFVQVQIIVAPYGKNKDGKMEGTILQANLEDEKDFPYDYDVRHPMTGRGIGEGIPEELFEHQRWWNFFKTEEARAVAVGGKVIFVTDSGDVVDSIFDDGIEHGTILKIGDNKTFTQANVAPSSVPAYQSIRRDIEVSGDRNSSSFNAVLGEEAKSNVPFKAQYLQDVNGSSQFLKEREDMGLFIQDIVERRLLPKALENAAKDNEIYETFSRAELQLIDEVIVNKRMIDERSRILLEEKRAVSGPELEAIRIGIQTQLDRAGAKRSIDQIKDFIKEEVLGNVIIHTTDEQRNKAVLFESYSNLLTLFGENDPARFAIRDRILDQMGVTKDELALYAEEAKAAAMAAEPPSGKVDPAALAGQDKPAIPA